MAKKQKEEEKIELELDPIENKAEEAEIQVENAEDPPEIEVKAEEPPAETGITTDDGIKQLRLQLEEERQARIRAEQQAREAAEKVYAAKNEVEDTNLRLIENAITTLKNNEQILKQRFKAALSQNDHDEAAEIQVQMSELAVKKLQLEQGKLAQEEKMKEPKPQPVVQQNDPVELLASQLTPRSAQWVRAHPEYARNSNLYQKMIAAHTLVVSDGIQPDSDEYFDAIETTLNIKRAAPAVQEESALSSAAAPTQRRSAPPAAPVSRSPVNNSGTRPNVVRLTAAEREMAAMMDMTDQEYARQKMALIKEGKLN